MADISVNEYVRTLNQGIKRIDRIDENKTVNKYLYFVGYDHNDKEYKTIKTTEITKHSFNLIDLIEVGDYVNGERVIEKDETMLGHYKYVVVTLDRQLFEENISTIVTKEQFKAMEYEVREDD